MPLGKGHPEASFGQSGKGTLMARGSLSELETGSGLSDESLHKPWPPSPPEPDREHE